jgi:Xaa-Pro dipeptidase
MEAHPGAEWSFAEGMVFHSYVLARGFGMSETIVVRKDGAERLTTFPRQLFVTAS